MRLHRFFVDGKLEEGKQTSLVDTALLHQLQNVFRLKPGNQLILLDNSGYEFLSEIVSLDKKKAVLHIRESKKVQNIPQRDIYLFCSLIKKDLFEWVLEKGTELGVSHFVPVVSERSEKKDFNLERGRKIIREASEQSGRGTLPEIISPIKLSDIFDFKNVSFLAFHPEGQKFSKKEIEKWSDPVGVLIGPEGGWSEKEIELFREKHIPIFSLGKQILRAETAAIVISARMLLGS